MKYSGSFIYARAESMVAERGQTITGFSKAINIAEGTLRKMKASNDGGGGTLDTLSIIANGLGTSVAYLIGETDDPAPIPPNPKLLSKRDHIVLGANAGPVTSRSDFLAVALSLETQDTGSLEFLLSEDHAVLLRHRLHDAVQVVSEVRRKRASKAS